MSMIQNKYFTIEYGDSYAILRLNLLILLENESFEYKQELIQLLHKIEENKAIKILVFSNNHADYSLTAYTQRWEELLGGDNWESDILRVFRTYNELFLCFKSLNLSVIAEYSKPVNISLLNFSMSSDLRIVSDTFYVDNDNRAMVNIPKGMTVYSEMEITFRNPLKLLFLQDKITADKLYERHLIDIICKGNIKAEITRIGERLSEYDKVEFEAIKIAEHKRMEQLEQKLLDENEFLLSCIRTKINQ